MCQCVCMCYTNAHPFRDVQRCCRRNQSTSTQTAAEVHTTLPLPLQHSTCVTCHMYLCHMSHVHVSHVTSPSRRYDNQMAVFTRQLECEPKLEECNKKAEQARLQVCTAAVWRFRCCYLRHPSRARASLIFTRPPQILKCSEIEGKLAAAAQGRIPRSFFVTFLQASWLRPMRAGAWTRSTRMMPGLRWGGGV